MGLSWIHILIVVVVVVLLFGPGKISGLMGDVAKGIKSFKKGIQDDPETPERDNGRTIEHSVTEAASSPSKAKNDATNS